MQRIVVISSVMVLLAGCSLVSNPDTSTVTTHNVSNVVADTKQPTETAVYADLSVDPVEPSYRGTRLAGTTTPFLEFNTADYEAARAAGKLILLDFYASWCPICRAEEPEINAGFDALDSDQVVGFRVHYNDDAATDETRALARQFGVTYQHTKVLVSNDEVLTFTLEQWNKTDLITAVNNAL